MSNLPVKLPDFNKPVRAVLKNSLNWIFHTDQILVAVDESDCSWRFYEGDEELDYCWDVVYWEYCDPEK